MKKIIITLTGLLVLSCQSKKEEPAAATTTLNETTVSLTEAQLKNADLALGQLEKKSLSSVLKVNGQIDVPPQNLVSISMPLGSYLKSTKLLPGMHINKGEVIATMEDQQ